jgi:hypothetical protein
MDHLDWLSNRIGPRLTSSDNLQEACEWTRDRFASFGIEDARLEEWGEFPVGFNRGPWFGQMVEPKQMPLRFCTPSWSAGTKGKQKGRAVRLGDDADLDRLASEIRGAWILQPPRGLRTRLSELGVAGFISASRSDLIVTSGNYRVSWDDLPKTPSIDMVREDFDQIAELVDSGQEVILELDVRNYFRKGPIKLYNVLADIPGTEFPDEYVIVGGHIDSWDGATGTNDNGTGCATTLEAARILMAAGVQPRRTIRFMLWGGEEQGLLGSRAYCEQNQDLMDKISAVFVHDMGTNYLSGISGTKAIMPDFQEVFQPVIDLDPEYPFELRETNGLRGGGSDHASFLSKGVPGFFWGQAGDAVYRYTHHTQNDTYEQAIPAYQEHSSLVVALAAYGVAQLDHKLSRENLIAPRGEGGRGGRGGPPRRQMGVVLDELTIMSVSEGTRAEKAGFKEGDVILRVDGKPVADRDELVAAIQAGEPKKTLVLERGGQEIEFVLDWSDERE